MRKYFLSSNGIVVCGCDFICFHAPYVFEENQLWATIDSQFQLILNHSDVSVI